MTFVPFESANEIVDRFLSLLAKNQINPPIGSRIETELLSMTQLMDVAKNPSLALGTNEGSILREAAGLHDLAAKILSIEGIPEFPQFLPHLGLIAQSKFPVSSIGQNAASGPYDDTARKMAELYIGSLAAHAGTNVVLDDPNEAVGDNPDVMFDVEEVLFTKEKQRWAIAVKTISSKQGQTIFERIEGGAEQIDRELCKADLGMVVINAKSALDHQGLWDPPVPFGSRDEAANALLLQLEALAASAGLDRPSSEWDKVFSGRTVRPVLFMGQSLVKISGPQGMQIPTPLKMFYPYSAGGSNNPVAEELQRLLNHFMQTVLFGIPGGPNQMPE